MNTWTGKLLGWLSLAAIFSFGVLAPQTASAAAAPSITTQPASQSIVQGSNAVFTVVASGQATLLYQWTLNGTNLANNAHFSGATNATLTVNTVTGADAGNYQVTVSNSHGSVTSSNATLTVLFPAAITSQPMSQVVSLGDAATFTSTVAGTEPMTLQWFFNGMSLTNGGRVSGAYTPTLTVSNVQLTDAGSYYLSVSNFINVVTSSPATLTPVPVLHYVDASGTNPVAPYTNWGTAAICIQDAINRSTGGDTIIVTNGVYEAGGYAVYGATSNRVALTKPVLLRSVNGPKVTTITGNGSVRCLYLTNGAAISGFTVTNGNSPDSGGGIWCESRSCSVSNCVITGNFAAGGQPVSGGGGIYGGTLYFCSISGNRAYESFGTAWGGGANNSELYNCHLTKNRSVYGGGAYNCVLKNCLITENQADVYYGGGSGYGAGALQCVLNNCTITTNRMSMDSRGGAGAYNCAMTNCIAYDNIMLVVDIHGIFWQQDNYNRYNLNCSNMAYCCTFPVFSPGNGNFSNPPCFVNPASGNFRLQTNSPCINTGNNLYAVGITDLDGRQRINGSMIDVGAYEFQSAGMGEYIGYLQKYALPTDGTADTADTDGDVLNNWQEWKSGTVPTNAVSVLKMASATNNLSGMVVTWQSVSGITYYLQRSSDLAGGFTSIVSNLVGQAGSTSYPDTTATNAGPYFYRVGVQ